MEGPLQMIRSVCVLERCGVKDVMSFWKQRSRRSVDLCQMKYFVVFHWPHEALVVSQVALRTSRILSGQTKE